jgi:hypothetical protein
MDGVCIHLMIARGVPFESLFNAAPWRTGDCPFTGRRVAVWDGVRG